MNKYHFMKLELENINNQIILEKLNEVIKYTTNSLIHDDLKNIRDLLKYKIDSYHHLNIDKVVISDKDKKSIRQYIEKILWRDYLCSADYLRNNWLNHFEFKDYQYVMSDADKRFWVEIDNDITVFDKFIIECFNNLILKTEIKNSMVLLHRKHIGKHTHNKVFWVISRMNNIEKQIVKYIDAIIQIEFKQQYSNEINNKLKNLTNKINNYDTSKQ